MEFLWIVGRQNDWNYERFVANPADIWRRDSIRRGRLCSGSINDMGKPKTLRKPANWQDFERLCQKLWGEIWECAETKRNGRNGQSQQGVDIYGTPKGEKQYIGIQCKGKVEYSRNFQFTSKEIDEEVENAKQFKPALKKLYFATTAQKDVKVEEYIREKNIENINKGLFEVHIFSWEDIVDLIDENQATHDWYLKEQNFKTSQAVDVTFVEGGTETTLTPKFERQKTEYYKALPEEIVWMENIKKKMPKVPTALYINSRESLFGSKVNLSYVGFAIRINNTGKEPLQDYKLLLNFKGDIQDLKDTNVTEGTLAINPKISRVYTTFLNAKDLSGKLIPKNPLLVSEDSFTSDKIFIKAAAEESKIIIEWKLISRDFKDQGELTINLTPSIKDIRTVNTVDDIKDERTEYGAYEDCIVSDSEN